MTISTNGLNPEHISIYLVVSLSNSNLIPNLGISFRGNIGEKLAAELNMIDNPSSFRGSARNHDFSNVFYFNIQFENFWT